MMDHSELMSMCDMDSLYFMHYGVKGMKWGVRKEYKASGRRLSSKTKSRIKRAINKKMSSIGSYGELKAKIKSKIEARKLNKEVRKADVNARKKSRETSKELKMRQLKNMSNEEIKNRIDRIRLENQYLEVTQTRSDRLKSKIKSAIGTAVSNVAKEQAQKYIGYFIDYKLTGGKEANGKFSKFAKKREDAKNPNKNQGDKNDSEPNKAYKDRVDRLRLQKQELQLTNEIKALRSGDKKGGKKSDKVVKQPTTEKTSDAQKGVNPLRVDSYRMSDARQKLATAIQRSSDASSIRREARYRAIDNSIDRVSDISMARLNYMKYIRHGDDDWR